MTSPDSRSGPPLHAFVLLARGRPGMDYAAQVEGAGLQGVRYRPVGSHHAFLVVRPGRSLPEAAQLAEYDLQDALDGTCWVLLCPTCDLPLSVAPAGYSCSRHGTVLSHNLVEDAPDETTVVPQRRRPSRHRSRSAHKREAMGAAWARFLKESATGVVELPHLVEEGHIPDARPAQGAAELGSLRAELAALLAEVSSALQAPSR